MALYPPSKEQNKTQISMGGLGRKIKNTVVGVATKANQINQNFWSPVKRASEFMARDVFSTNGVPEEEKTQLTDRSSYTDRAKRFGQEIFQGTIGSQGFAGTAKDLARSAGEGIRTDTSITLSNAQRSASDMSSNLFQRAKTEKNPELQQKYRRLALEQVEQERQLARQRDEVDRYKQTGTGILNRGVNSAITALGMKAPGGLVAPALERVGLGGLAKIAAPLARGTSFGGTVGQGFARAGLQVGEQALLGGGSQVALNVINKRPLGENVALSAGTAGAIPALGAGYRGGKYLVNEASALAGELGPAGLKGGFAKVPDINKKNAALEAFGRNADTGVKGKIANGLIDELDAIDKQKFGQEAFAKIDDLKLKLAEGSDDAIREAQAVVDRYAESVSPTTTRLPVKSLTPDETKIPMRVEQPNRYSIGEDGKLVPKPYPSATKPNIDLQPQPTKPTTQSMKERGVTIKGRYAGSLPTYKGEKDLTTKILKDLEGKATVSKQYILDATNRPELKQAERDLIRQALEKEGDTINVPAFAKKVKAELLPLEREPYALEQSKGSAFKPTTRYESIALPSELRGNVKNYSEQIYKSPIKTSAGEIHFGSKEPNYFGHTRIEDMADNQTRRVIEVQSDLMQKGNLERELPYNPDDGTRGFADEEKLKELFPDPKDADFVNKQNKSRLKELSKLQPYRNTFHERLIREEIKKAAQDGKTKLQFPTGETAMKIEGLGGGREWFDMATGEAPDIANLKVGQAVQDASDTPWIIREVLGDGKFKAVPKSRYEEIMHDLSKTSDANVSQKHDLELYLERSTEEFDISGKVDTNNPIYKFYKKDVQKYLNKFGGKVVVDEKGVSWIEVPIRKEMGRMAVEAYGAVAGIEPEYDEEGNIVGVKYDPVKGAIGLGIGSIAKNLSDEGGLLGRAKAKKAGKFSVFDKNKNLLGEVEGKDFYHAEDKAKELFKDNYSYLKNKVTQKLTGSAETGSKAPVQGGLGKTQTSPTRGSFPASTSKIASSFNDASIMKNSQSINVDNLNISTEGKKLITDELATIKPELEAKLGKTLTNKEVSDVADESARILTSTIGRKQTAKWEMAMLKLRQRLSDAAEKGEVSQQFLDDLLVLKTQGADIGRKLQSLSQMADPKSVTAKQLLLEKILETTDNVDEILAKAKGVDFNDYKQATDFYRQYVKPTMGEWVDLLRYNSMLSSPLTHMVNIFSNLGNTLTRGPLTKLVAGGLDWIKGGERTQFAGEAGAYLKGYFQNTKQAFKNLSEVMRGASQMTNLDMRSIPLATKGGKGFVSNALALPLRALEGMDRFFMTLSEGAERSALNYRGARGVKIPNLSEQATDAAKYGVFRQELFKKGQGTVLNAMDTLTSTIMSVRNSDNPIVSTIAKFTLPFVQTPMNILKQGVEYSPFGVTTIVGAKNKTEQLAKTLIGTAVAVGAGSLLTSDRMTWGEPKNANERNLWRENGKQPYSIKFGDKWYSYQKLPPFIAFPMSMVAAVHEANKSKKLSDTDTETLLTSFAKYSEFLADQSYFKSIGDLFDAISGDEYARSRLIGNYPQQLIPARALGGWLARLTDGLQRQIDNKAGFIDKQIQLLMLNVPFISQRLPARIGPSGEAITNRNRGFNAFSPVRVSPQTAEETTKIEKFDTLKQQSATETQKLTPIKDKARTMTDKIMANLKGSPEWANMTPREQEQTETKIYNRLRERLEETEYPQHDLRLKIKARLQERGMASEEAELLSYKIIENANK